MKQINFSSVAHLYLGCKVLYNNKEYELMSVTKDFVCLYYDENDYHDKVRKNDDYKPILYKLSDMPEEFFNNLYKEVAKDDFTNIILTSTYGFFYLTENSIDIFNLIDSKQAINGKDFINNTNRG
jgi:hypothetical protein